MSTDGKDNTDWNDLGLPPYLAAQTTATAAKPTAIKRSAQPFIKFPVIWFNRLAAINANGRTYQLAGHLLHRMWRTDRTTFILANVALREIGISRDSKRRALHELEKAGLVLIERRTDKSPVVHLLLCR